MDKIKKILVYFIFILLPSAAHSNTNSFISDSLRAEHLISSGIELARNGMDAEALDSFLISLKIRKKYFGTDDYKIFANNYRLIAIMYKNLGFYDLAIEYSKFAEEAYVKGYGPNIRSMASVYLNLGNVYRGKLNYNEALQYYNQMVSIYLQQENIDKGAIAGAYYSIAEVNYRMYNYAEVIKITEKFLTEADEDTKIQFYDLLANTYLELNDIKNALENYQKAIQLIIDLYSETDPDLVYEYLNLAQFYIVTGELEDATNQLDKAKKIIDIYENESGEYSSSYYRVVGILAENKHIASKDMDDFKTQRNKNLLDAIVAYKKALTALNFPADINSSSELDTINNISDIECLDLLKFIGNVYVEISSIYEGENENLYQQNLDLALNYYNIGGSLIQRLRKEISGDENKIVLAELEQSTFIDIVKASLSAYNISSDFDYLKMAFQNAERLKSGSIFDKLEESLAKDNSLIPDSLKILEKTINSRITAYSEQRYNESTYENPDSSIIRSADAIINKLKQQRTDLNDYMEKNYPDYFDLKYSSSLLDVNEVRARLKKNEVLIEYVLNETDTMPELYAILISPNNTKFIKQDIDNEFIVNISETFHFLSNSRYMFTKNEDSKNFCISSYNLYQKLISPFEDDIQDKKIIIIPDGKLNYIAFDALIDEMPDTTGIISFNKLNYLIKKNCVNYSYSANLLYKFNNLSKKVRNGVLAFAPDYNNDTFIVNYEELKLTPLPGIKKEVETIAKEVKTKIFEGQNATELNFRNNSDKYDILHLAMHAFINDSLPAFSSFAFSQNKDLQPDRDGWLNTADIYNLNLNARLTVLSACNTGTGTLRKGEGVMSLARGFLYAGCPSIVMTLWEVEDNSGTKIMSSFYKFLKKGKPKDEALRQAKLEYLSSANPRLAHPHYWLGYVSIGNNNPLFRSYDFYFFSLLILAFAGILTEQIIRIKKARKKSGLI